MLELAIAGLYHTCLAGQRLADSRIDTVPCTSEENRKYQ